MKEIEFTVHGPPVQQGSVRAFNNRVVQGGDEKHRERLSNWRSDVRSEAYKAMNGAPPDGRAVTVDVSFYYARPKKHYGTGRNAQQLKESAPTQKDSKPDLDKLVRSLLDALTGIVINDDDQVVGIYARKDWSKGRGKTHIHVEFSSQSQSPEESAPSK